MNDDDRIDTFRSLLHARHAPLAKLVVLELARRGGEPRNITQLADDLYATIGEIDSASHSLVRAKLIEVGPNSMFVLHKDAHDLVDVLGDLVEVDEEA